MLYVGVCYKSFASQELFTIFKQMDITVCEIETEGKLVHNSLPHHHRDLASYKYGWK